MRRQPPATASPKPEILAAYQLSLGEYSALRSLRSHLNIKRDTASRLISVSFASHDAKMAALITNTVVTTFIDDTYRDRHDAHHEVLGMAGPSIGRYSHPHGRIQPRPSPSFRRLIGVSDVDADKSTFTEQMAGSISS